MYGHPSLVAVHAQALAPSRRNFWAWWKANTKQGDLFGFEGEGRAEDGGVIVPIVLSGIPDEVEQIG